MGLTRALSTLLSQCLQEELSEPGTQQECAPPAAVSQWVFCPTTKSSGLQENWEDRSSVNGLTFLIPWTVAGSKNRSQFRMENLLASFCTVVFVQFLSHTLLESTSSPQNGGVAKCKMPISHVLLSATPVGRGQLVSV